MNMHAISKALYGEYVHDEAFETYMTTLYRPGSHEAPTTYKLPDGKWCLMLDFFGCEKDKMGYVPLFALKSVMLTLLKTMRIFHFRMGLSTAVCLKSVRKNTAE